MWGFFNGKIERIFGQPMCYVRRPTAQEWVSLLNVQRGARRAWGRYIISRSLGCAEVPCAPSHTCPLLPEPTAHSAPPRGGSNHPSRSLPLSPSLLTEPQELRVRGIISKHLPSISCPGEAMALSSPVSWRIPPSITTTSEQGHLSP